ncbi:hypothetical protein METBIDRAFT_226506 [Metschnikowia bicuspidata var. bicuspidata NRRL YB-4993]|uniref:Uncharacterized protein n=1 Tax=Metschnikowia bicuspidata var. bicuspidata NRRL YB-4993 TaxID=869754 RepID=A0A1A0H1T2_9ASCO|nr:hypothetical protein METBIDRAFT_226506 [Metschnikowia bicuspidata var. bicuspidata NRRL YB-4993]OBA17989.1 hypothetical protein METBIDRAFT_226506 [Metschnikowia bicuspidata var. bicuspidata NRRL YB-4993]
MAMYKNNAFIRLDRKEKVLWEDNFSFGFSLNQIFSHILPRLFVYLLCAIIFILAKGAWIMNQSHLLKEILRSCELRSPQRTQIFVCYRGNICIHQEEYGHHGHGCNL